MVERGSAQTDEHLARPGLGIGRVLVAENLGPAVLVDPNRLQRGTISHMQVGELGRIAEELGLDVVGAAAVSAYDETERHIRERRARGLFADMRFTMARPEVSCHPETLLDGARTVVSAALCYWSEGGEVPAGHGRLPRYAWYDAYAELREKLDELGRRLGGAFRVLVDANQHVDREAAARSGESLSLLIRNRSDNRRPQKRAYSGEFSKRSINAARFAGEGSPGALFMHAGVADGAAAGLHGLEPNDQPALLAFLALL